MLIEELDDDQSPQISYETEGVELPLFFDEDKTTDWINNIAEKHKSIIVNITYVFCDDAYLLDINKTYLNHDFYTDIITFPFQQGKTLESDIFISHERVEENAQENGAAYQDELLRVMAHGILHLLGFKDKSEKEIKDMREAELQAIEVYHSIDTQKL